MGCLLMLYRKMQLIQQDSDIQFQLTQLNQKLMDYQSLSATLSNESVTMTDVASIPASLFGAGIDGMMMAHNQASQYAQSAFGAMTANGSIFNQPGVDNQQMMKIAYMKLYEQGRQEVQKRQEAALNEKEKQLTMKIKKLETMDAAVNEEMKSLDGKIQTGVQQSVSHYGLQA